MMQAPQALRPGQTRAAHVPSASRTRGSLRPQPAWEHRAPQASVPRESYQAVVRNNRYRGLPSVACSVRHFPQPPISGTLSPAAGNYLPWKWPGGHQRSQACHAHVSTGAVSMTPDAEANGAVRFLMALYQFTRPHTMLGTFVSVVSVSLLALQGAPVTSLALKGIITALVPALLMNVCIVGMNQLYDVEIDKVNKPYLPLASGEFNMATGTSIVAITGFVSLVLGILSGSAALLCTLVSSLALGVLYSVELPLLRWKQNPLLAAICVLSVRAVAVQMGFYVHMLAYTPSATVLQAGMGLGGLSALISAPLAFTIGFMFLFSIVIALFKDIPDSKGDMQANVRTLTVRMGVEKVFWICIALLELGYTGAVAFGASRSILWSKVLVMLGHALLGGLLWHRAQQVNLKDNRSITECYMFIWKLFYLEYLLIPLFQ